MKTYILNILSLTVCLLALVGCNDNNEDITSTDSELDKLNEQRQLFNESVAFLINADEKLLERHIAHFELIAIDEDYEKLPSYDFNGQIFSDNGEGLDTQKSDGIYTAQHFSSEDERLTLKLAKSDRFIYNDRLDGLLTERKLKIKIRVNCRLTEKKEGTTILGFSCEKWGGCIETKECKVEIEIES
ncbi:hypothetical protein MHTCC0001_13080 [Flavobacteriaceae bacterium MHTCC 0001]